jgi:tRNA nucleotidyltransferase/poly(A) polymerase
MAQDSDGNIVDMYGGQKDIKNKIIRAVGKPEERFREDPLRMLRALQFATRFDFTIEPETAAAIKNLAEEFKTISGERILGEFKKAWTKGKRNTNTFISLLQELGVGKTLFGGDFQPKAVTLQDDVDLVSGNFVAFFLRGGNPSVLKPTNDMMEYLNIAKAALHGEQEVWEYAGRNKDKLPLVAQVLKHFDREAASEVSAALELPLTSNELAIGGRDLMAMGLKGPQIGQAQREIMQAIHSGEIQNEPEDIKTFLGDLAA